MLQFHVILLIGCCMTFTKGFQQPVISTQRSHISVPQCDSLLKKKRNTAVFQPLQSTQTKSQENEKTQKKRTIDVTFVGKKCLSSQPVPIKANNIKTLDKFFMNPNHRNLLLSKDGTVELIESPSQSIIERWSRESQLLGGCDIATDITDDETCDVLQTSTATQFPGLKVITRVTFGSKVILPLKETNCNDDVVPFPEYQFTLIDTEIKPQGSKPLVWLFNKLTGSGNDNKKDADDDNRGMSSSLTRVTMSQTATTANDNDDANNNVIITTDALLETRINIPSTVMRLLPVSLEKFEEQGSLSMQKAVEKDVGPALERFREAYLNWLESEIIEV